MDKYTVPLTPPPGENLQATPEPPGARSVVMDDNNKYLYWFDDDEIALVSNYLRYFFEAVEKPLREGRQPKLHDLPGLSPEIADRLLAYALSLEQEAPLPPALKG